MSTDTGECTFLARRCRFQGGFPWINDVAFVFSVTFLLLVSVLKSLNDPAASGIAERRTAADIVFDALHEQIVQLRLLPGTKVSESEIARQFGVSRQPVRDAFNRLGHLELLIIRPQRATAVRGFSLPQIAHDRFVRMAVELEVVRQACALWDDTRAEQLADNLQGQQKAVSADNSMEFHALDYRFHQLICELAGHPLAFQTIQESKRRVDRMCRLSLERENECAMLLTDHRAVADALAERNESLAVEITRVHLRRLDDTIADIHEAHAEYFE